ncbi:MAG: cupredoxin domain-containing protein [Gemmatimonadaceae bacterium]
MMRRALASGLFMIALAGCGGGGGGDDYQPNPTGPGTPNNPNPTNPNPNPSNSASVTVSDNEYNPATTNVTPGTTVTWSWAQGNYVSHSVTFADGTGSSAAQTTGTHSRTFATAGTYNYQCSVHGAAMAGSVVVAAPANP